MGYPTKSLSDLLNNLSEIEKYLKPSFFSFVLYKSEHTIFREYILHNFNELHDTSRDVVFFLIDNPEDWFKRDDIQYYNAINNNINRPQLDEKEVDLVCDHFGIHPNKLPAVISFPSLRSSQCNIFSLKEIQEDYLLLTNFFKVLFSHRDYMENTPQPSILGRRSLYIRKRFPKISTQLSFFEFRENVSSKLELISQELKELRAETKEGFEKVLTKLEHIQNEIISLKGEARDKLNDLVNSPANILKDEDIDLLHQHIDSQIHKHFIEWIKGAGPGQYIGIGQYDFLYEFETETKDMIRSCLIAEQLVNKENIPNFDYSLCSVGFWKALEIELNIIIPDAIRYIKEFVSNIPSEGISIKNGQCKIYAGTKYYNNRSNQYFIDLNKKRDNKLISLMFGDLIRISENYYENDYQTIIDKIQNEIEQIKDKNSFMDDFTNVLKEVVYNYRNRCSHTEFMGENEYEILKGLLLSKEGLFQKVSLLKAALNTHFLTPSHSM